jgi:hypothetical protein
MKVLGISSANYRKTYIAEVSHEELQKLTDKYYGKSELPELKVGDELNIGAGYDFRGDIREACKKMAEAMQAFNDRRATMSRFAALVAQLPVESDATPPAGREG